MPEHGLPASDPDDVRASQLVTVACLEISPTQCEAIRFVKTIRFVETILSVGG